MRICAKLEAIAITQKIMAWAIVIMVARSDMSTWIVIAGCLFGIYLNEAADVWYKIIPSYKALLEIKKSAL